MKIGLYIEHGVGNGVGGAELMMAHLASVWSRDHDVELVHHRPPLTRERLSRFTTDDLGRVTIRPVSREPEPPPSSNPIVRFRSAQAWHETASAPYDLFVNCTHWLPSFCHARAGTLLVLFPFYVRPHESPEMRELPLWKRLRHRAYYEFEWRRRLASYGAVVTISEFSRQWTRLRWGLESRVIYPPVETSPRRARKQPLILTVGRFSTMAHTKKQLEMACIYSELHRQTEFAAWTFACVGGLNDRDENHRYFDRVAAVGRSCGALVEANVEPHRMRELYNAARIYWHATGLDDDTDAHPELAEHFGISTVEAMAQGCVPVVVDKGAQREIVEHGRSGFVWSSVTQLVEYTKLLATDVHLWSEMSAAARQRAQQFGRERFITELSEVCHVPLTSEPQAAPVYLT